MELLLRLISSVFTVLLKIKDIIVSGYFQRRDITTGRINDDYLFSCEIDRKGFGRTNFNALKMLDPIVALNIFGHRKKMTTTGIFQEIDPFERNELH